MPAEPQTDSAPVSRGSVFARRFGSALLLLSVTGYALLGGSEKASLVILGLAVLVLNILGLREFFYMAEKRGLASFPGMAMAGGLTLAAAVFALGSGWSGPDAGGMESLPAAMAEAELAVGVLFLLALLLRRLFSRQASVAFASLAVTVLGVLYVSWLINFIQKVYFYPKSEMEGFDSGFCLLYFILVTKCSDIGAYCVGSLIGRRRMTPQISPGKTWEGLVGGVILSVVSSLLLAYYWGEQLGGMPLLRAALLGGVLSLGAVAGDLVESILKRDAGVKDSGHGIPGMGGVLDLMDSLLFNAPLMYLYLRYFLPMG